MPTGLLLIVGDYKSLISTEFDSFIKMWSQDTSTGWWKKTNTSLVCFLISIRNEFSGEMSFWWATLMKRAHVALFALHWKWLRLKGGTLMISRSYIRFTMTTKINIFWDTLARVKLINSYAITRTFLKFYTFHQNQLKSDLHEILMKF